MDLLLDTSAFLYWSRGDRRVPTTWVETILDPANTVFLSAASAWEVAIKRKLGKLEFHGSAIDSAEFHGFTWVDITPAEAEAAGALDWEHRDPFDRLLAAQSLLRRLVLVTTDAVFATAPGIRTL
jgi:PIN domain nuclease of toxin-antitoxin system